MSGVLLPGCTFLYLVVPDPEKTFVELLLLVRIRRNLSRIEV